MATWILTGDLANFRIYVDRAFDVIGFKERWRNLALELEPGDEIVFYVKGEQAFGGIARATSPMFEDRTPIWPRGPRNEDYPWRVKSEPVVVLDESRFVAAEALAGELDHVGKWPADHWHLAFQGQLRAVSDADGRLLGDRIAAAAGVAVSP